MSWPIQHEKRDEDDEAIQIEIANIIKNIHVQEYEQQKETEKLDIHHVESILTQIRQDIIKEFSNNTIFVGAEEILTDNSLYNIRRAYIHYCRLMLAHFIMVKKDVVADTSTMFNISNQTLLMYLMYGETAFRAIFTTSKTEEENTCDNCGA